jgi:hypothetical protein
VIILFVIYIQNYAGGNIFAFNYYNILTDPNNHHYVNVSGYEQTVITGNPANTAHPNELYYYTGSDSHPTAPGHLKATDEFIPLLNGWYNLWKGNK